MTARSPVIFLHIGAMKTGTTYLQQVLIQNKDSLAEHGYLFPGRTWTAQVRAAHDAVGHHRERQVKVGAAGAWRALAEEMLGHDGAASIFSVEFLGFAGRAAAERIVRDLAPAEVHVVLTVRDTCAVLPALWQTHCANGGTASWASFARSARLGASAGRAAPLLGQGARLFRRALDVPRMLDIWGALVPTERLHVVTVPPPGAPRDLLWRRFAGVIGLDPEVATNPAQGHNPSLGYPSADLMRRLNAELGRLPRGEYNPTLKHHLAEKVLARRAALESRAGLDARAYEFGVRWNRRTRAAVEASGAHLVGDLEDLPATVDRTDLPKRIEPPDRGDLLAAAATALQGMGRLAGRRARRLRALGGEAASQGHPEKAAVARAAWAEAPDPLRAAVEDVADACRVAIAEHERIRRLRG